MHGRSVDIGLGVEGVTSPCEEDSHSSAAEVTLKLHSDPERPTNLPEAESEAEPGLFIHTMCMQWYIKFGT